MNMGHRPPGINVSSNDEKFFNYVNDGFSIEEDEDDLSNFFFQDWVMYVFL